MKEEGHIWRLLQLLGDSVPGAIASDVLVHGDVKEIVVGGLMSGIAIDVGIAGEENSNHALRYYFHVFPMLGLGIGYLLCRSSDQSWQQALLGGVIGFGAGLAAVEMHKADERRRVTSAAYSYA